MIDVASMATVFRMSDADSQTLQEIKDACVRARASKLEWRICNMVLYPSKDKQAVKTKMIAELADFSQKTKTDSKDSLLPLLQESLSAAIA